MPNTREMELLVNKAFQNSVKNYGDIYAPYVARDLLDCGVTFDKDNDVPSKWIPVTERLPEELKEVLVYRFTGCEVDSCVSHQKQYWSYDPVSEYPVTHWMPLPEPPKGE